MTQREKKSSFELEVLCLAALKPCLGMQCLNKVTVGPYRGPLGFTWEIALYDGNVGEKAIIDATSGNCSG